MPGARIDTPPAQIARTGNCFLAALSCIIGNQGKGARPAEFRGDTVPRPDLTTIAPRGVEKS